MIHSIPLLFMEFEDVYYMVQRLVCLIARACCVFYSFELVEVSFILPCPVIMAVKFDIGLNLKVSLYVCM